MWCALTFSLTTQATQLESGGFLIGCNKAVGLECFHLWGGEGFRWGRLQGYREVVTNVGKVISKPTIQ